MPKTTDKPFTSPREALEAVLRVIDSHVVYTAASVRQEIHALLERCPDPPPGSRPPARR